MVKNPLREIMLEEAGKTFIFDARDMNRPAATRIYRKPKQLFGVVVSPYKVFWVLEGLLASIRNTF